MWKAILDSLGFLSPIASVLSPVGGAAGSVGAWVLDNVMLILAVFVMHTLVTLGLFAKVEKWRAKGVTFKSATPRQKVVIAVAVATDFLYNVSPAGGSLVLWQFPRKGEWLFTAHLQRLVRAKLPGYRYRAAKVYCWVLNKIDKNHCKDPTAEVLPAAAVVPAASAVVDAAKALAEAAGKAATAELAAVSAQANHDLLVAQSWLATQAAKDAASKASAEATLAAATVSRTANDAALAANASSPPVAVAPVAAVREPSVDGVALPIPTDTDLPVAVQPIAPESGTTSGEQPVS